MNLFAVHANRALDSIIENMLWEYIFVLSPVEQVYLLVSCIQNFQSKHFVNVIPDLNQVQQML